MVKKQPISMKQDTTKKLIHKVRTKLYSHGYSTTQVHNKLNQIIKKITKVTEHTPKTSSQDITTKDQHIDLFNYELDLLSSKHYDNYDSSQSQASCKSKVKVYSPPEPQPKREETEEKQSFDDPFESPIQWRISRERMERLAMERDRERTLYRMMGVRSRRPRNRQEAQYLQPVRRLMMRRRQLQMEMELRESMGLEAFHPRHRRESRFRIEP